MYFQKLIGTLQNNNRVCAGTFKASRTHENRRSRECILPEGTPKIGAGETRQAGGRAWYTWTQPLLGPPAERIHWHHPLRDFTSPWPQSAGLVVMSESGSRFACAGSTSTYLRGGAPGDPRFQFAFSFYLFGGLPIVASTFQMWLGTRTDHS
ncbi:hypothetical protein EDB89DRAFT_1963652 [Lactarius sanguifluus]|nr:hypothetical protein EDB89DRAFT_1963652 [Lactarius sanguifluus]